MKVKRYDPTPYNQSCVVERPNGEYVKYTDYAKLEERVLAFMAANGLKWDMEKVEEAYQSVSKGLCEHDWEQFEGDGGYTDVIHICKKCGKRD